MISRQLQNQLDDSFLFENIVCNIYNSNRSLGWKLTQMRLDPVHVYDIMHGGQPEKINMQEVIAIAKAVCQVMGVVCPIINNL